MDMHHSHPLDAVHSTAPRQGYVNRRILLKAGIGVLGVSAATFGALEIFMPPNRIAHAAPPTLPNIQFDISNYIAPVQTINGVNFRFGPVYTLSLTAQLTGTPKMKDQQALTDALNTIESAYAFSPSGAFLFISYGLPYFNRLPGTLVSNSIPRLLSDTTRLALEEAIPSPTDVSSSNPGISKPTYNVPVKIEANDVLFTIRSDNLANLQDIAQWLQGNSKTLKGQKIKAPDLKVFTFTSSRLSFIQSGLPRSVANTNNLSYATTVNPQSPMWMGFSDQQVDSTASAANVTFQGSATAQFTTAKVGDYFADGAIQHFSHVILDLGQWYANTEPYVERCQYMFRSNPCPALGNTDQFTDGGGPTFLDNVFQGTNDAQANAQGVNTLNGQHRMGHVTALQRSSRASNGTPLHIRMDGPGFDALDVPGGSNQPKLNFTAFVPTADFFATMRKNQASLDLVTANGVANTNNGIERFTTTTRRQNFLVPPRAHRAFPLLELGGGK